MLLPWPPYNGRLLRGESILEKQIDKVCCTEIVTGVSLKHLFFCLRECLPQLFLHTIHSVSIYMSYTFSPLRNLPFRRWPWQKHLQFSLVQNPLSGLIHSIGQFHWWSPCDALSLYPTLIPSLHKVILSHSHHVYKPFKSTYHFLHVSTTSQFTPFAVTPKPIFSYTYVLLSPSHLDTTHISYAAHFHLRYLWLMCFIPHPYLVHMTDLIG